LYNVVITVVPMSLAHIVGRATTPLLSAMYVQVVAIRNDNTYGSKLTYSNVLVAFQKNVFGMA